MPTAIRRLRSGEVGERGFHDASISGSTRRAGVALGSFYTYLPSKDAMFRALIRHLSDQVRNHVPPAICAAPNHIAAEHAWLASYLGSVRAYKAIHRIIAEAEFVDPDSFRRNYASTAKRIAQRLAAALTRGEVRSHIGEAHAWAIMGMNGFLGRCFASGTRAWMPTR